MKGACPVYKCAYCGKRWTEEWGPCDECLEQIGQENAHILYAPLPPLPAQVWQEVLQALTYELPTESNA